MVASIVGESRQESDAKLYGFVTLEGKKLVSVSEQISKAAEEMRRFVAEMMGHDLANISKMNVLEYFRDYVRAKEKHEQMVKKSKEWEQKT